MIYLVEHCYDVDGGFGDAIPRTDVVVAFTNEDAAIEYVEKYNTRVVYDSPYADLEEGMLVVTPISSYFSSDDAEAPGKYVEPYSDELKKFWEYEEQKEEE